MSSVLTENIVLSRTRSHDLRHVKKLNCWGSELSDVSIVQQMPNVEVLSLSINNIASLQDFSQCKNLQELYLRKNKISDINEIYYLQDLSNLKKLTLEDNPCNQQANYRYTILKALPQLEILDNANVTTEELAKAQTLGEDIYDPSSEQPSYPPINGHSHQKLTIQQKQQQQQQLPDDEDYEIYDEDVELSREESVTYREKDDGSCTLVQDNCKPLSSTPQNGSNSTISSLDNNNIRNKHQGSTQQLHQTNQPNQQQQQQQSPPQPSQGNGLDHPVNPPQQQQVTQQHSQSQAQLQQRYSLQEISPDNWNPKDSKQVQPNLTTSTSSTMLRSQSVSDYNIFNGSNNCNNSTTHCRSTIDAKSCISDQTHDIYQYHNENGSGNERYSPLSSHGGNGSGGGSGSCGSSGGSGNGSGAGRRYGYQSIQSISSQQKPLSKGGRNRNANILSAVLCLIKELDYASLEVVETAIHCRMEEMED
ncbi:myb-like protein AA isoform X2 [Panonychus citri]|uniref:myb-like protein AA isoform X2 n=1 Tax=Panonychus citri TaxID=50023 RepID=UPI0023080F22|nr:myb-like protein AA isoform X2 [Panonychus citri]